MALVLTNKFSGNVNSSATETKSPGKTAATVNCGTVTNGALLIIVQSGTLYNDGTANVGWATPSKSSGTATIGTVTLIDQVDEPQVGGKATSVTAVWRVAVTGGGTLVLSTDDTLPDASDGSYGWVCHVDEWTGQDTTTPVTGLISREDVGDGSTQVSTPADSTLGATPASGDYTVEVIGWDADTGTNTSAAGTGFTEVADIASSYSLLNVSTRTGSTSTTVVWPTETSTGLTYSYGAIAFIIKAHLPVVVSDDFNRADGGLGANWTAIGTAPGIVSNKAQAGTLAASQRAAWTTAIGDGATSIFVEADVVLNGGSGAAFPGVLLSEANNSKAESYGVVLSTDGTEVYLTRTTGGTDLDIATNTTMTITNGVTYKVRLEWFVGGSLKVYVDGVERIATTNTDVTPSYAGIQLYTGNGTLDTIDNFRAGTLPRTTAPTLVAYSESNPATTYADGATITAGASFSWVAGDVVVVAVGNENAWSTTNVVNKTNLTFVAVSAAAGVPGAECYGRMYYATATGSGSGAMTATASGSSGYGHIIQAWHFTDTDGIGNKQGAAATDNTRTQTMTAQAQSAVLTAWYDFNAINANWTGETNTGTLMERSNFYTSGRYSGWAGDWSGVSAGSDGWGVQTGGSVLSITFAGTIEVLGKTVETVTTTTITPVESVSTTVSDTAQLTVTGSAPVTITGTESVSATVSDTAQLTVSALVVSDDFNRANGALGSNWTTSTGADPLAILSNELTASTSWDAAYWNANTFPADCFAEMDFTGAGTDSVWLALRADASTDNEYSFDWNYLLSGTYKITKWVAGVETVLASVTGVGWSTTRRIRGEVVGTSLKMYVDGIEELSTTDSTFTAAGLTHIGIKGVSSSGDNFRAGGIPENPATFSDDFNRANGNLIDNNLWINGPRGNSPVITSNEVVAAGLSATFSAYRFQNAPTTSSHFIRAKLAFYSPWNRGFFLSVRGDDNDSNNCYALYLTGGSQSPFALGEGLYRIDGGTPTRVVDLSGTTEFATNDIVELSCTNANIYYRNVTTGFSGIYASTTYNTNKRVGLGFNVDGTSYEWFRIDDVSGGDLPQTTITPVESVSITVSDTAQLTVSSVSITDYIVEYRTTSGPGAWQRFTDGVNAATGATVTGLSPGVSYDFRVAGVNANGIGTWSNVATVTSGSSGVIKLNLGDTQLLGLAFGDISVTKAYVGDTIVLG